MRYYRVKHTAISAPPGTNVAKFEGEVIKEDDYEPETIDRFLRIGAIVRVYEHELDEEKRIAEIIKADDLESLAVADLIELAEAEGVDENVIKQKGFLMQAIRDKRKEGEESASKLENEFEKDRETTRRLEAEGKAKEAEEKKAAPKGAKATAAK